MPVRMIPYRFLCFLLVVLATFSFCTFWMLIPQHKLDTPYPALERLVNSVDSFLWSRFDITSLTEDFSVWDASDVTYGFDPTLSVPDENIMVQDFCPILPLGLQGILRKKTVTNLPPTYDDIERENPHLPPRGFYRPLNCKARHKVAIVVPHRNRENQLRWFLSHIHPILQRQQIEYGIYVINQVPGTLFNRAKLMNVGFVEASNHANYDCYIFHDVDLLVENDMCWYYCPDFSERGRSNPKHLSASVDKFNYETVHYDLGLCSPVPYQTGKMQVFGGVSIFTKAQFTSVNGFSNSYWGWGAEDDDLFLRTWRKGYKVDRSNSEKCSFRMLPHEHESNNPISAMRYLLLKQSLQRSNKDGLNSLRYRVVGKMQTRLYVNITVDIGRPSDAVFDLMKLMRNEYGTGKEFSCFDALVWLYNRLSLLYGTVAGNE